jgi:hypothetical protein
MQQHACPPQFDTNPLTKIWQLVTTSHILITNFPKYVKLVELAMVQMVGNMEDEFFFSFMAFMKSKLHNRLTTQLLFVVWMFTQRFYIIQNFPYEECIEQWRVAHHCYYYDG